LDLRTYSHSIEPCEAFALRCALPLAYALDFGSTGFVNITPVSIAASRCFAFRFPNALHGRGATRLPAADCDAQEVEMLRVRSLHSEPHGVVALI